MKAHRRRFILVCGLPSLVLLIAACTGDGSTPSPTPCVYGTGERSETQVITCVLALLAGEPRNEADASTAKATRMTEQQADTEIASRGGPSGRRAEPVPDRPVWLVEVRGEFALDFRGFGLPPTEGIGQVCRGTFFAVIPLASTQQGLSMSAACTPDERPTYPPPSG